MPFSPGDIVQLKSGGPAMTVSADSPDGVHCLWHGEVSDEIRTAVIPAVCLEALLLDGAAEAGPDPQVAHPAPGAL